MDNNLPLIYLSILIVLLAIAAIFVLRQIVKTRQVEGTFNRLQNKLQKEKGTAQNYNRSIQYSRKPDGLHFLIQ